MLFGIQELIHLLTQKESQLMQSSTGATSTDKIEGMEELEGGEASVREFLIKKNSKNIGIPIEKTWSSRKDTNCND